MVLTLAQIQKMPRTVMRVQHHCVEGWSAVASWHGVRLSEVAKNGRAGPTR
jgi:DMSO/TMAO reductase YedYZ molybdopterin-dependent catalytic subunit